MDFATKFFVIKGVLGALGVVLLIWHMDSEWERMKDGAQRARYLCLLGFGVLIAGASGEQIHDSASVEFRHWGSLVMATALVLVSIYSIVRARARREGRRHA